MMQNEMKYDKMQEINTQHQQNDLFIQQYICNIVSSLKRVKFDIKPCKKRLTTAEKHWKLANSSLFYVPVC